MTLTSKDDILRIAGLVLVSLVVFVMPNQLPQLTLRLSPPGFPPKQSIPLNLTDLLLLLALIVLVARLVCSVRYPLTVPPWVCFAIVVAPLLSLYFAKSRLVALKEIAQLAEYFIIGVLLFSNLVGPQRLRTVLVVFIIATSIVAFTSFSQYLSGVGAFRVNGTFEDRNALGTFFSVGVPPVFAFLLWTETWGMRISLLVITALALCSTLSGGALLAVALTLIILSALRGRRALILTLIGSVLAFAPVKLILRGDHPDVLKASLSPFLKDNFLLSDAELVERAKKLKDTKPEDALRAIYLLSDRKEKLADEEERLLQELEVVVDSPSFWEDALPARRYQRWASALVATRENPSLGLLGKGLGSFTELINRGFAEAEISPATRPTNQPEFFNLASNEPNTFNLYLTSLVEGGFIYLLSVLALWIYFGVRALRLYFQAHSEFAKASAMAIFGSLFASALCGIFSSPLTRGIGLSVAFLCSCTLLLERIVCGEEKD